jgi:hypothetical protein
LAGNLVPDAPPVQVGEAVTAPANADRVRLVTSYVGDLALFRGAPVAA